MEISKFRGMHKNTPRKAIFFIVICFITLCIVPPNFRPIAEILKELERQSPPSDLVQAYYGKFQCSKNGLSIAILHSDLLHGTLHHPTKFQANS